MKSVLLGNGINIQFGGPAYTSEFIMKRIKYGARLDKYKEIFGDKITSTEIEELLNSFVSIANEIRVGKYDNLTEDSDTVEAINDFQNRYKNVIDLPHEIMLEDWFLIIHLFFLKNKDIESERIGAVHGFEYLILDAIYNGSKIQDLHRKMNKRVKQFFKKFDHIFTLNYDNNIELLTGKRVYHLHGDFSVLANSENVENVLGYIRTQKKETIWSEEMKHCYCNALLNYSGKLKYETAKRSHDLIIKSEKYLGRKYETENISKMDVEKLKERDPLFAEMLITKIKNPGLKMGTEYYFNDFEKIQGELSIIGMSPNNDSHIFNLILKNTAITKVIFYYFDKKEKDYIESNFSNDLFECKSIQELWRLLDCRTNNYNCNHKIPNASKDIIAALNVLSDDEVSFDDIKNRVNKIPEFEMQRLCEILKEDMRNRNPLNEHMDEKEFIKQTASIGYIALQEGILPTVLYLIAIMNYKVFQD